MSCKICRRSSCTRSFHSLSEQDEFDKILAKGSARQRALLFFNDAAEKEMTPADSTKPGKGFLTEAESKQLWDSFKTDAEIKLYNKLLNVKRGFHNGYMIAQQQRFQWRETIASLAGYCLLFHGYTEFEHTLNAICEATEDPEQKKRFFDVIEDQKRYLWADIGPDKKRGHIRLQPHDKSDYDPENQKDAPEIREVMATLSKRAFFQLGQGKTMVKALRDHLEAGGLDVKLYKDVLDGMENDLKDDKAPLPKFSRKKTEAGLLAGDDQKKKQRMKEIFGSNWLFPEYEEAEIDEELYTRWREGGILG